MSERNARFPKGLYFWSFVCSLFCLCEIVWCGLEQEQWNWTGCDGVHRQWGYKQEWYLSKFFLICILLPSGTLTLLVTALRLLANTVALVNENENNSAWKLITILCRTKGKVQLLYIEDAEILRSFSIYALTFGLRTYAYSFLLLSVARSSFQTRIVSLLSRNLQNWWHWTLDLEFMVVCEGKVSLSDLQM